MCFVTVVVVFSGEGNIELSIGITMSEVERFFVFIQFVSA